MRRLFIVVVGMLACISCSNDRIAGTADDVNTGSIFGIVKTDTDSIGDTVLICLYNDNASTRLSKMQSGRNVPLKTVKTQSGAYAFDSLAAGTYRIEAINDSIVIGKSGDISLAAGEREEVDVVVVAVITIMISITTGKDIIIDSIAIGNGRIRKLTSGYILTVAGVDTQSLTITFDQNGATTTTEVRIVLQDNGTATFEADSSIAGTTITPSYVPDCLVPGAIACLPFDNGSADDASGNGNNGRIAGATPTLDRFGNPQGALFFDGRLSYVMVDSLRGTVPGNSPKSISGWFKSGDTQKETQMLFGFGAMANSNNFQIGIGPWSDNFPPQFRVNGWGDMSDWRSTINSNPYFDDKWHHCVVTYDSITTRLYLDGSLMAQTSDFSYITPRWPMLVIGNELDLSGWEFDGALDDVRIFNRAIDGNDVLLLYNQK